MKVLGYIRDFISDDCRNHLPGVVGIVDQITANSMIAHAEFSNDYIDALTNGSNTNLSAGLAIAINDMGLFFNPSLLRDEAGYVGGSLRAQLMILLHELGHFTGAFGSNDNDQGDQAKIDANNNLIKQHCGAMIDAATVIP